MKKEIISAVIVIIIVSALFHLALSYINWNINPSSWPERHRSFVVVLGGFISLCFGVVTIIYIKENKEEKK